MKKTWGRIREKGAVDEPGPAPEKDWEDHSKSESGTR